jgi:hypothetical protein
MGVGGQRNSAAALPPGKRPVLIVQEAGRAPGAVWTSAENLALTKIRSLDRPACSVSYNDLSYPGPHKRLLRRHLVTVALTGSLDTNVLNRWHATVLSLGSLDTNVLNRPVVRRASYRFCPGDLQNIFLEPGGLVWSVVPRNKASKRIRSVWRVTMCQQVGGYIYRSPYKHGNIVSDLRHVGQNTPVEMVTSVRPCSPSVCFSRCRMILARFGMNVTAFVLIS